MRFPAAIYLGCVLLWTFSFTSADVRRVPQDYATIQTAFDSVADGDTVLVSLGTYAEELSAPPLRFWMIGDMEIDTGNFARPVIDPSNLDSARWRRCLTVPNGCELTIERMGFVNRAPMYPRDQFATGGITVNSALPLTFRYCSFDSVWRAIAPGLTEIVRRYVVDDCRFTYAPRTQIFAPAPGGVEVRRCYFHAYHMRGDFVNTGPNSVVEECIFTGDSIARGVAFLGLETEVALRNCIFGPVDSCSDYVFQVWRSAHATVEGNVFRDIRCGYYDFAALIRHYEEPLVFRHNSLINISTYGDGIGTGLAIGLDAGSGGFSAQVDSNIFMDCTSAPDNYRGKAMGIWTPITATGNHFVRQMPESVATVNILPGQSGSVFRYNQFEAEDYGVGSYSGYGADALWNYWGDVSGPYNPTSNPEGLGARVDDSVLFDPWCPDTNCFLSVPGLDQPLPKEFVFEAYPNPFNSTVHLTLIPSEVQIVKVELFDLLGRRVKEIWSGPLAFQKDITFDASALSSGIYFARVTDVIDRNTLVTAKLVLLR